MAQPQHALAPDAFLRHVPGGDLVDLGRPLRHALELGRHVPAKARALSRREGVLLGLFALTLHGAVIYWLSQQPTPKLPEVPPQVPPMTIEFTAPTPPVVEPAAARADPRASGAGAATSGGGRKRGETAAAQADPQTQAETGSQARAQAGRATSAAQG